MKSSHLSLSQLISCLAILLLAQSSMGQTIYWGNGGRVGGPINVVDKSRDWSPPARLTVRKAFQYLSKVISMCFNVFRPKDYGQSESACITCSCPDCPRHLSILKTFLHSRLLHNLRRSLSNKTDIRY